MQRSFAAVRGLAPSMRSVSVVTYNVLADKFGSRPGKHDYCPPELRDWAGRGARLMEEILAYSADILCLQEVEKDKYISQWEPILQLYGYEGVYYGRAPPGRDAAAEAEDPVEGCVVLYKASKFACRASVARSFADLIPEDAPSSGFMDKARSLCEGAALAVLECRGCGTKLVAASTHIHWDPQWPDIKAFQTSLLTKMVSEATELSESTPVVIAGDFNSLWRKYYSDEYDTLEPDVVDGVFDRQQYYAREKTEAQKEAARKYIVSGAYELMAGGRLSPDHPHHPNQRHAGLPPLELTTHRLSLASAHLTAAGREPPLTTKTDRFAGCLDYVFVNPRCQVVGLLDMPYEDLPDASDPAGSNIEFACLPNEAFGSDHLAVGCQLQLCQPAPCTAAPLDALHQICKE